MCVIGGVACSHDPVCGNKVIEKGETCDKGELNGQPQSGCSSSCQLQNIDTASIQVFYNRLKDEVPGFLGGSCKDLGIKEAHVRLVGPTPAEETWPCSQNSKNFGNVEPGDYQAFITLFDDQGAALTDEISSDMMTVARPGSIDLTINFTWDDFTKHDYTGVYYFNLSWGQKGTRCAAATPGPVTKMQVTMTKPGTSTVVTGTATPATPLDGSSTDCFTPSTGTSFIKIPDVAAGHYDIKVVGLDGSDAIQYCKKYDTFVGPGVGTPTFDLVVDAATTCP